MPITLSEAYEALDRLQDALRAADPEHFDELQAAYDDVAVEWLCD